MGAPGRWRISAAVTAALLIGACTSPDRVSSPAMGVDEDVPPVGDETTEVRDGATAGDDSDDGFVAVPTVPASTTPAIPTPQSAELLRQERLYDFPEPLGPLAAANGVPPALLPPGDHTTDVLGIGVTLHLDRWWRLDDEIPGSFVLNRPESPVGALLPVIVFGRPVGLALPDRVDDLNHLPGEYDVPADELGSWLDDVPQIEVLATGDAVAGDRTGRWYDVEVDPSAGRTLEDCSPGVCVHAWWSGASGTVVARDQESLRYYEFPDPYGPIFVLVAAADDEFDEWVAIADGLIRATRFGASSPHPVPEDVSVGRIRGHERGEEWRFTTFPGRPRSSSARSRIGCGSPSSSTSGTFIGMERMTTPTVPRCL